MHHVTIGRPWVCPCIHSSYCLSVSVSLLRQESYFLGGSWLCVSSFPRHERVAHSENIHIHRVCTQNTPHARILPCMCIPRCMAQDLTEFKLCALKKHSITSSSHAVLLCSARVFYTYAHAYLIFFAPPLALHPQVQGRRRTIPAGRPHETRTEAVLPPKNISQSVTSWTSPGRAYKRKQYWIKDRPEGFFEASEPINLPL